MAKNFLVPINMNGLEIQNFRVQNLASQPSGTSGKLYFNTADSKLYYYDGTDWIALADAGSGEPNQNAFSYVDVTVGGVTTQINADKKMDELNLVFGSLMSVTANDNTDTINIDAVDQSYAVGTKAMLEAGTNTTKRVWDAKTLNQYVSGVVAAIDAMRFKGTLGTGGDVSDLPTTDVKVGDTYRVVVPGIYAGVDCEVGDLVIATETTPTWTVAQTNIDGAITAINAGSGISVSGTGSSRTISISLTAFAASYPTGNTTPSFGDNVYIPRIKQSASGQVSADNYYFKIPDNTASTSAKGLMSALDKEILNDLANNGLVWGTLTLTAGQTSVSVGCNVVAYTARMYNGTSNEEVVIDMEYGSGTTTFSIAAALSENITIFYARDYSDVPV